MEADQDVLSRAIWEAGERIQGDPQALDSVANFCLVDLREEACEGLRIPATDNGSLDLSCDDQVDVEEVG